MIPLTRRLSLWPVDELVTAERAQAKWRYMVDPPGFFPLIVRGGRGIRAAHDGGTLTLQFGKSPVAAGDPSSYGGMPLGTAAWVDRPLNDAEPAVLKQEISESDAESVVSVLGIDSRFYMFMCSNTNAGHFQVHRSEPAFMQGGPID